MLQLILDAYAEKNKNESFFKSLKKMDNVNKAFLGIIVVGTALSIAFFITKKFEWAFITIGVWIITSYILIYIIFRRVRKNWNDNIQKYNNNLDCLKEILCEKNINYYSENKIKKLIIQCEKSIDSLVSEKEESKKKESSFIEKYIFPIITFGAGAMSGQFEFEEVIQMCIIAIILVAMINFCIQEFRIFVEQMEGNKIEEKKYLLGKLEDLLIRDFEVGDSNT